MQIPKGMYARIVPQSEIDTTIDIGGGVIDNDYGGTLKSL